jgi:hypothetical protein
MKTPILGSSYVTRSPNAADARMINLYPEVIPEGGKEAAWLQRAPGLRLLSSFGSGPIRGLWTFNGKAYAVSGTGLYQVDTDWAATYKGVVAGAASVTMTDNGTQLFIAAGANGYIYNSSTSTLSCTTVSGDATVTTTDTSGIYVNQPVSGTGIPSGATVSSITNATTFELSANATASNVGVTLTFSDFMTTLTTPFAGAVGCGFIDGWFVFNQPDSQIFWAMDSTGTTIDPLYFASAEGSPDNLVTLIVDHREVWLFGSNSVEVWYDAGTPDFPFARIQGAFNEIGCLAPYSVAKLDNGLFWLGADARGNGIVYRSKGYSGERVSTHAVEWQIQQYASLSDATAYTYQQDGHSFYVLNFPTANTTWVYDVATGAWHERGGWENDTFTRTRGNCQMNFNNEIVIGDYRNGELYAYDLNVYSEAGTRQKWLRSWRALPTGQNNLKRTTQHSLQLDCQAGVGLDGYSQAEVNAITYIYDRDDAFILDRAGSALRIRDYQDYIITVGADPQVMLRWSDDGGHTWSNEHWKSMGQIGQTGYRTIWRRLGMTMKLRDRVYEISGTDPVKIAIMGAELIMDPTNA